MKPLSLPAIALIALLAGFSPSKAETLVAVKPGTIVKKTVAVTEVDDRTQIQNLIRDVLVWSQKQDINLLPAIAKDSIYLGFDLAELQKNLQKLKATNLFSAKFIENYKQIILALDKQVKNKHRFEWKVGDMPPFAFVSGTDPWCLCQDVPYDEPHAFKLVEVQPLNLAATKGLLIWKWGALKANTGADWKDFSYKFEVEKEHGVWKISYLQGFDFNDAVK